MDNEHHNGNPYDFRSPVRHRALLAGRSEELASIDEFLREASSGRPVHFSLFGGQGSGKSSLLNGVVELARDRDFLAVKLALREAIVETELDFYKALYDAALQVLLDDGQLGDGDSLMRAWVLQTCTGDLPPGVEKEPLELGLLVAARVNGRMVTGVPTPLIKRDLQRFLSMSGRRSRGLVLCLDGAELLDDNRDLGPSLLQLADSTPLLTIVTAAEGAGSLQKAAPRAWAQVEVGPFRDPGDVFDAITKPVDNVDDTLSATPPTLATAMDIRQLTGGVPYEVNLVCHFIWDAIQQGELESFELSPTVIERVTAELEEKGRHQASGEIATFSTLSASDYQLLVEFAPYEALTMRQLALVRLMLDDYEQADLQAAGNAVGRALKRLEDKGVVRIERDRFEVVGSRDARLYLKYAAQRHTGRKLRYRDSYQRATTDQCAAHLGRVLAGDSYDEARVSALGRPHEVGGSTVGEWLDGIGQAATAHDIVTLADQFGAWLRPDKVLERGDDTFILFGLQLQAGLHDVEHAELVANVEGRSVDELREAADRWVVDNEDLLAKYDVRVVDRLCEEIPAHVLRASLAYWQLRVFCQLSYMIYRDGSGEAAEELLGAVLEVAEKLVGPEPADPLLRTQFANALHRLAFMAATRSDWETALTRLEHSRTMALTDEWLLDYNEGYVRARQGDITAAVALASSAVDRYEDGADRLVLHAHFPTRDDWIPSREQWNVVELQGNWVKRFLDLQLLVLRALETTESRAELASKLEELSGSAPAPLLRLAGWAQLTIFKRPDEAANIFARAVVATPYVDAEVPQLEVAYAEEAARPTDEAARAPEVH
jgi:hypothetical protein